MAGFLSSVFISGQLADRFGRRPIILLGIAIFFASALACTFSTSYVMFTTLRYFVAFGASGAVTTAFVLLMEVIGAQYRTVLGVSFQFGWALGYVLLPALAWFVREWSNLHLTLTVPWILLCSFWWLLPESPRWLITHGKVEQVEKEIETALRINHKNVTDIGKIVKELMYKETREEENKNRHATFFDLLKTPNMRKKTLNSFFAWFVIAFVYYGLSLSTNDLGGDPYINFFVSGAVEFPSYAISIFVIKHLGRRIPLVVTMVLGGLACMLTIPIPDYLQWLTVTLAMFGKFCISASFGIVYVYSAELFPTVVRNVGVGSSSMCARVGSMVAPFVKELSKATNNGVPLGIFGGLSVVSGILILLLPETNNMPLPDTLEEGEAFGNVLYPV
ncbi:organic cation transporter protein-like isoform X2 [Limulus polyphemus]|uniref:Organic cation transporter protein-like isoform X2 n=1 Tax=Limulus polyphemus TaxID=6850 RepID=A0ABM1S0B8_LIMPO|nr:organic cation transporter protein-like isoform X2 [Limulus polyphemus]